MNREFIDSLEEYISKLVDILENNTKNSLEKIAILQKSNELGDEFSPKFDISKRIFSQLHVFPTKTAHPFFDFGCAVHKKLIFDSYVFLSFLYVFHFSRMF